MAFLARVKLVISLNNSRKKRLLFIMKERRARVSFLEDLLLYGNKSDLNNRTYKFSGLNFIFQRHKGRYLGDISNHEAHEDHEGGSVSRTPFILPQRLSPKPLGSFILAKIAKIAKIINKLTSSSPTPTLRVFAPLRENPFPSPKAFSTVPTSES